MLTTIIIIIVIIIIPLSTNKGFCVRSLNMKNQWTFQLLGLRLGCRILGLEKVQKYFWFSKEID